jgi:hypothetical protein
LHNEEFTTLDDCDNDAKATAVEVNLTLSSNNVGSIARSDGTPCMATARHGQSQTTGSDQSIPTKSRKRQARFTSLQKGKWTES